MPLYRVTHRHLAGQCGYENTIVADDALDAIRLREVALDLDDPQRYTVYVETVPDPDGSKARRWLELFGMTR